MVRIPTSGRHSNGPYPGIRTAFLYSCSAFSVIIAYIRLCQIENDQNARTAKIVDCIKMTVFYPKYFINICNSSVLAFISCIFKINNDILFLSLLT